MSMEDIGNFRGQLLNMKNKSIEGKVLNYKDATVIIQRDLEKRKLEEMEEEFKEHEANRSKVTVKKDKEYLHEIRRRYTNYVKESVSINGFTVIGYGDSMDKFIEEMVEEAVGYSVLYRAMNDKDVDNVFIISWDKIFIERNGVNEPYPYTFKSETHFRDVLTRFLNISETEINSGDKKIVHSELFGDRGCATDKTVSPRGTSLTLRKHPEDHITLEQLLEWGTLSQEMSDFLGMLIKGESNIVIAGITGSGKTTTLRALIDHFISKLNKRMLVAEDTQELFPKNEHTLELVSVKNDDPTMRVTLNDIILTSLRLQPKYIIVGEVRGEEAQAAVEAMETGHSTIFSMHGGKEWNVINRIVTKYIVAMPSLGKEVVERIIGSAIDYVVIQADVGGVGKRVTAITEIDYDYENNKITLTPIFKFNHKNRDWDILNKISPEKADFMIERGVSYEEIEGWIREE